MTLRNMANLPGKTLPGGNLLAAICANFAFCIQLRLIERGTNFAYLAMSYSMIALFALAWPVRSHMTSSLVLLEHSSILIQPLLQTLNQCPKDIR